MNEGRIPPASATFHEGAEGYAATMALSLRPVAAEVVRHARLEAGERVLDIGTGTGIAAAAALGEGRSVVGVDGAPGMVAIAQREVAGAEFQVADFMALPFPESSFDVVVSSHALLFAEDRVAALREWHRVVRPRGRLSLSVPGPSEVTPTALYGEIYERYGLDTAGRYPTALELQGWAETAGWQDAATATDATVAIRLADEAAFRTWRHLGARGSATAGWSEARHAALTGEMMAATPRDRDNAFVMPFGAIYLSARKG